MLIRIHQEVYGNSIEKNQLQTLMTILLVFLMITIIIHFKLNNK